MQDLNWLGRVKNGPASRECNNKFYVSFIVSLDI